MDKEMLTLKDLSNVLDLSMPSIYKLIKTDNTFPIMKLNNKYSVSKKQLDMWIERKSSSLQK